MAATRAPAALPTPASHAPASHAVASPKLDFTTFYRDHFLAEHRHPIVIALHVLGTLGGAAYAVWALFFSASPWLVLGYPLVHAVPGLVGHRYFERNEAVGDLRVLRKDFPSRWFIAANHRLTWDVLSAPFKARRP